MARKERTLVFSFDGTDNEPSDADEFMHDQSISNILKLHVLMGERRTTVSGREQTTYYYNGIGTRGSGTPLGFIANLVNKIAAPAWAQASDILNDAEVDLNGLKPKKEDIIVVFGFSRGAALARKFASDLLEKYSDLNIAFLGVFDTVTRMVRPHQEHKTISDVEFDDTAVHPNVQHAVHILSLDENRIVFEPTQMNRDADYPGRIHEIWFPGVHSDIGGGYWHDGLADVALQYMIDQCRKVLSNDIFIEESSAKSIRKLLDSQSNATLKALDVDDILIHPNVTGAIHAHTEGWRKIASKEPRNVCVRGKNSAREDVVLPPDDHLPMVHHSVKSRFDLVPEYRPPALRGLNFKILLSDGKIEEIKGIADLRELKDDRSREERMRG